MNAILLTKGTWGDLVPFLAVGRALKHRGHSVTLVTHAPYETLVVQAGLKFAAIDTQEEFSAFIADGHLLNTPNGIPKFFRKHYLNRVEREYRLLLSLASTTQSIFVARHMYGLADLLAHERIGVPIVRLYLSVAQLRARFLVTELCRTALHSDIQRARTLLGFGNIPNDPDWSCSAAAHIVAWPEWFFAKSQQWPSNSFTVGFLVDDETEGGPVPSQAATILDSHLNSILVTAGTGMFLGKQFYDNILRACASLPCNILLTGHRPDEFLVNRPINVQWFQHLPFASVMPRVVAVVHHAGAGTFARSLMAGVPQLLLPYGGDRTDTAARGEALGIGRMLLPSQWHSDAIIHALDEVLNSPNIRDRCLTFSKIARQAKPAEAAAEIIEHTFAARKITGGYII
jgi:rhamnosyltransferase subunit B